MKTILYILLFNISAVAFAQNPALLDREWFLNEIVINGETYLRTPNVDGSAHFLENDISVGHPMCTGAAGGTITYTGTDIFEIFDTVILLDFGCNPDATTFMNKHYEFYGIDFIPHNPFEYLIEANGAEQKLTVTNVNGDYVIYGSQPILAVESFNESAVFVYPNPAKDKLHLSTTNPTENLKVKIFNIEGKLLSNLKLENQTVIDVSNLTSGMYFLNIEDENGNTTIKKFLKE